MAHVFRAGEIPLLVSFPHNGSFVPEKIAGEMTDAGRSSRDSDWFLDRLYGFPELEPASWLIAEWSRYVIDLNRPADDRPLYPGQTSTGLVPDSCFDGSPIHRTAPPTGAEVARRVREVWQPWHDRIEAELRRMLDRFGVAVLLDAHSIASEVPRLFEGRLPDFNLGTNRGGSCDPSLTAAIVGVLEGQSRFSHVVNGRFVGGYITRHYGNPQRGVHAVQMELSQATYLDESRREWDSEKAKRVQPVLRQWVAAITDWVQCRQN